MGEFPAGVWSRILVGRQWPSDAAVAQLDYWKSSREYVGAGHEFIADSLRSARTGALAVQEGVTAAALVDAFGAGERSAREIAGKNYGKAREHAAVRSSVDSLRDELRDIAERGNREIGEIQDSKTPAALQVPKILSVIAGKQQEANIAAAKCGAEIAAAGQRILDREAGGESFRRFAGANGIDMGQLFRSRSPDDLAPTVIDVLAGTPGGAAPSPGLGAPAPAGAPPAAPPATPGPATSAPSVAGARVSAPPVAPGVPASPMSRPATGFSASPTVPSAGAGTPQAPLAARAPVSAPASPHPAPAAPSLPALTALPGRDRTGGAAVAGTSRGRLQRIVDAAARQQPRLAWAAGDRRGRPTVLVTDLAGGWIPPGIAVPAAVALLDPDVRRGDLESLLGDVESAARYAPGSPVPGDDGLLDRLGDLGYSRRGPHVDDLGWLLTRATRWRDGLPRLAHTVARAAWQGTGVPDAEAELLGAHLAGIRDRVLASYPDGVDAGELRNWQLLAAVGALVAGDDAEAGYHFAWFRVSGAASARLGR